MSATLIPHKKTTLFLILAGIFITNAITAEIIGVKIFSLEQTLGLMPAQVNLFGLYTLDFNLTAGVLIWPVVFLTTDIINEYFGKDGVRKITILTSILIAYVFVILWVATIMPPAAFWLDVNSQDVLGNPININAAYATIFRQGGGIIIGSLTAFLLGQFLDVYVFHFIRKYTGSKYIWLRATGSTIVSQLVDSFVVLFIAFYVFGGSNSWKLSMVFSVGIINYMYKFIVALAMTPLLYLAHGMIDKYLGEKNAITMINEADKSY